MSQILVYHECCAMSGEVVRENSRYIDDEGNVSDDVYVYGETEDEACARARKRLAITNDTRPGGAGDAADWKAARNVLRYCGMLRDIDGGVVIEYPLGSTCLPNSVLPIDIGFDVRDALQRVVLPPNMDFDSPKGGVGYDDRGTPKLVRGTRQAVIDALESAGYEVA